MPHIDISNGELLDRLSILLIKKERLPDSPQGKFVENEYSVLHEQSKELRNNPVISKLYDRIRELNVQMWDCMQKIYDWDSAVDEVYVATVVAIIEVNKERAFIKKAIDENTNSTMREAKSFFQTDDERSFHS